MELKRSTALAQQHKQSLGRSSVDRSAPLKALDDTEGYFEQTDRKGFTGLFRGIKKFGSEIFVVSNIGQPDVQTIWLERLSLRMIFTKEMQPKPPGVNGCLGIREEPEERSLRVLRSDR